MSTPRWVWDCASRIGDRRLFCIIRRCNDSEVLARRRRKGVVEMRSSLPWTSSSARNLAAFVLLLGLAVLNACGGKSGYWRGDGGVASHPDLGIEKPGMDAEAPDLPAIPATPTCTDHLMNGGETDIDCGGPCATTCANGKGCIVLGDCTGGVCTNGICQTMGCANMVADGQESDVDCGGPRGGPCSVGKRCQSTTDCASGICTSMVCEMPSCTDGMKNAMETDLDCGGPTCSPCQPGASCAMARDCIGSVCAGGKGAVASCAAG